jgi:predicted nucleotidyltransferase
MKTLEEIKSIFGSRVDDIKKKYRIKELGVFGSYVRQEQDEQSDIDVLVDFEEDADIGLFEFMEIEDELSKLLGAKVDLVLKRALKPAIGQHIINEVIYI